jgi:hypothetical protein
VLRDAAERESRFALVPLPLRLPRARGRPGNGQSGRFRGRHRPPSRFLPSASRPLPAVVWSSGARSTNLARASGMPFALFPAQLRIRVYPSPIRADAAACIPGEMSRSGEGESYIRVRVPSAVRQSDARGSNEAGGALGGILPLRRAIKAFRRNQVLGLSGKRSRVAREGSLSRSR